VATYGLNLDHTAIVAPVQKLVVNFSALLTQIASMTVYAIAGFLFVSNISFIRITDVFLIFLIYLTIIVVRGFTILLLLPFFKKFKIDISWRHLITITWGGLRKSVSLLLIIFFYLRTHELRFAYIVKYDESTEKPTEKHYIASDEFAETLQKILIYVIGVVILTNLINDTTTEIVMRKNGMSQVTDTQMNTMSKALAQLRANVQSVISNMQNDTFFADARWSVVVATTKIQNPYNSFQRSGSTVEPSTSKATTINFRNLASSITKRVSSFGNIGHQKSLMLFKKQFEEARIRVIKALKASYDRQQRDGLLTVPEARALVSITDYAAGVKGMYLSVNDINKFFQIKGILPLMIKKLNDLMYGKKTSSLVPPNGRFRRQLFKWVNSNRFEIIMQMIIVSNTIPIILDLTAKDTWTGATTWYLVLNVLNIIYICIYMIEFLLKVIGLGTIQYIKIRWNQFDVLILILALSEIIADTVMKETSGTGSEVLKFGKSTKVIRTLRATRLLRLSKTVFPRISNILNRYLKKRVNFGFNIGKGFLFGENEIVKLMKSISTNEAVQSKMVQLSERNREEVTDKLNQLQIDYNQVCVRVRTKNAIRLILNHLWQKINKLVSEGKLSEYESSLLHRTIKKQMKQEASMSLHLPLRSDNLFIQHISWIKGNRQMTSFFSTRTQARNFDFNERILQDGDPCDGIFIITSGMVQLIGDLDGHVGHLRHHPILISSEDIHTSNSAINYLGPGAVLGELRFLIKSTRSLTAVCKTAVKTVFLPEEALLECFEKFPNTEKKIWKSLALRIALPLYLISPKYENMKVEALALRIIDGYVIELSSERPTLNIDQAMSEVVIIYGEVESKQDESVLTGPLIVPQEFSEITLNSGKIAIILIILHRQNATQMIDREDMNTESGSESEMSENESNSSLK